MIDLRAVNKHQFKAAKNFWAAASAVKLLIFCVGAWAVFLGVPPWYMPQVILFIAIVSELFQVRSDVLKSRAETLLRMLDMCRSFGREISEADKRDIIYTVSRALRKRFDDGDEADSYFASTEMPGAAKAVENLFESAWYTKRQAGAMAVIYAVAIAIFLALSILGLIVATREVVDPEIRDQLVKVVTAWLLLIVSLNMLRSAWAYFRMYQRCQKTEGACGQLRHGDVTEADALRQWFDYQVARSSCPLLPQWLWKVMEPSLNDAWHRTASTPADQ